MTNRSYILAVDSSSASVEVCVVDSSDGSIVQTFNEPITLYTPHQDWFEYDAEEIWAKQLLVLDKARNWVLERSGAILGIGISNQRETVVAWDRRTLKPVYRAISWQDSRNGKFLSDFDWAKDLIRNKTGLYISEYFSASKIMWILENVECDLENIRFGTIDSWLLANMTNGVIHFTDVTNASRTMCMNLARECWDLELLDLFGIPHKSMPLIRPSGSYFGFWKDIAILGVIGDQQAALLTLGNHEGAVQCTYGTGLFVLRNAGQRMQLVDGAVTTVAWKIGNGDSVYALENGSFSCGRILDRLRMEERFYSYAVDVGSIPMSLYIEPVGRRLFLFESVQENPISINFDLDKQRGSVVLKSFLNGLALIVKGIVDDCFGRSNLSISEVQAGGQLATINYLCQIQSIVLKKDTFTSYNGNHSVMGVVFLVLLFLEKISWDDIGRLNNLSRKRFRFSPIYSFESVGLYNLNMRLKYSL